MNFAISLVALSFGFSALAAEKKGSAERAPVSEVEMLIKSDNAFAAMMMESAAVACPAEKIQEFVKSSQEEGFEVSVKSKTFPNGMKMVMMKFQTKTKVLAVERPFEGLQPHSSMKPNCSVSTKDLSGI